MSCFNEAMSQMGLNHAECLALIDNLYLGAAFKREHLWESVHLITGNFGKANNITAAEVFHHVDRVMREAGAYTGKTDDFKPEYLLEHLFVNDATADVQDVQDLIVYWSQSGFGRTDGQESSELPVKEELRANRERYLRDAKTIGLIDARHSRRQSYDETWILGVPRQPLLDRVDNLREFIDSGNWPGQINILTGECELCAETSGLYNPATGTVEGGKEYLVELARKFDIKINSEQPFVVFQSGPIRRAYLNYSPSESRRVTETSMARDMSMSFLRGVLIQIFSLWWCQSDWFMTRREKLASMFIPYLAVFLVRILFRLQ